MSRLPASSEQRLTWPCPLLSSSLSLTSYCSPDSFILTASDGGGPESSVVSPSAPLLWLLFQQSNIIHRTNLMSLIFTFVKKKKKNDTFVVLFINLLICFG